MSESDCSNLKNDLIKVSVMHTIARMYQGKSLSTDFMKDVLYDLAGFTVFHLAINPLIRESHEQIENGAVKDLYCTTVLITTVKIISALLAGKDIQGSDFITDLTYTLIGFALFDVFTKNIVEQQNITDELTKQIVNDIVKFGGMFIIIQLLNGKSLSDDKFIQGSVGSLLGFVVADFILMQ